MDIFISNFSLIIKIILGIFALLLVAGFLISRK